jgi:hypothetical protein
VDKFGAGFFSSGKAAGSVDTCSINSRRSMTEKRQASGKFQPAEAGEFSHGAFQPFANDANDRRAAVNSKPAEAGEFSHGTFHPFANDANGDRCADVKVIA